MLQHVNFHGLSTSILAVVYVHKLGRVYHSTDQQVFIHSKLSLDRTANYQLSQSLLGTTLVSLS